jgi:hypothetical protein
MEPKTRTEAKGRDKDTSRDNVYTGRHVRIAAAAAAAAAKKAGPKEKGGGKK